MSSIALAISTDKEIIEEYVSGNSEAAATAFVRKYRKFVYSIALRYLKSADDADDAAQESFIKALGALKKFRGDSSLKTWLYRITVNVCANASRKKKFLSIFSREDGSEIEFKSDFETPDKTLENKELFDEFYAALDKLPKKQRETFALRYFDELPYDEISNMIGTSVGGLKANYYQAVKKLAKFLKQRETN